MLKNQFQLLPSLLLDLTSDQLVNGFSAFGFSGNGNGLSSSSEWGGVRPNVTLPAESPLFFDAVLSCEEANSSDEVWSLPNMPSSMAVGVTRFFC